MASELENELAFIAIDGNSDDPETDAATRAHRSRITALEAENAGLKASREEAWLGVRVRDETINATVAALKARLAKAEAALLRCVSAIAVLHTVLSIADLNEGARVAAEIKDEIDAYFASAAQPKDKSDGA